MKKLQFLILLFFIVIINIFVSSFDYRYDFTDKKIFSLSPITKSYLRTIDQPISVVYAYDVRNRALKDAAETLRLFANESDAISLEIFDPVIQPSLAEKYGIRFAGTAIISSEKRNIEINLIDEVSFVNGLIEAVSSNLGKVCFTVGHLESDPFSMQTHDHFEGGSHSHTFGGEPFTIHEKHGMGAALNAMTILGYEVEQLLLAKKTNLIEECEVIVIASPQRIFMESEVLAVHEYLKDGGSLLLMLEPKVETGLESLFANAYGVSWESDFIYDNFSHLRADKFSIAVTRYPKHKITRNLALTVFPGAVSFVPAVTVKSTTFASSIVPLVETSEHAASSASRGQGNKKIIGLKIKDKANEANIILFGDGDFATNSFYNIGDNGRLFTGIISELAESENHLNIEPKSYTQDALNLTSNQATFLFLMATLSLPAFFSFLGIYVFVKSRF